MWLDLAFIKFFCSFLLISLDKYVFHLLLAFLSLSTLLDLYYSYVKILYLLFNKIIKYMQMKLITC